jgi:hypothetical protein
MSDIPDTISGTVSALAIAWEIVKITYIEGRSGVMSRKPPAEGLKELTNAVIKAQEAIMSQTDIQ